MKHIRYNGDSLEMAGLLFLPAFLLLITFVFASPIGATTSDQTSTTTTTTTTTHREHKVHNIVLYPDKHSWCRTTTIKQVISYPGCRSVEIDNNVCVGACFSYSIPHTEPSDPGEAIVPYCDSCQPSETAWQDVSLECSPSEPSRTTSSSSSASFAVSSDGNSSPQFVKRVQIITNCSCAPCDRNSNSLKPLSSSHTNLIPSPNDVQDDEAPSSSSSAFEQPQNDVPDLLNELQRRNESSGRRPEGLRLLMDNRIVELLQRIQETNQPEDRQQLKMFLQMIQVQLYFLLHKQVVINGKHYRILSKERISSLFINITCLNNIYFKLTLTRNGYLKKSTLFNCNSLNLKERIKFFDNNGVF